MTTTIMAPAAVAMTALAPLLVPAAGLAAAATFVAVLATTAAVTGIATLAVPWPLVGAVVAGAFLVTGVTSLLTSASATRFSPVSLVAATE